LRYCATTALPFALPSFSRNYAIYSIGSAGTAKTNNIFFRVSDVPYVKVVEKNIKSYQKVRYLRYRVKKAL